MTTKQYSFLTELNAQWKRALNGSAIGGLAGGGIGAAGRVGYNLIKGNKWDDSLDKYTIAGAGLGAAAGGAYGYFKKPNLNKMANQQSGRKALQFNPLSNQPINISSLNIPPGTNTPRVVKLLNLYNGASSPGEKQAAFTALQRLGVTMK